MIYKLVGMVILLVFTYTQEVDSKRLIAEDYIEMHNEGTEAAIVSFMKAYFTADDFSRIQVDKHVQFYKHIITEFGSLNTKIYRIEEETKTKLIIHLIKADFEINDKDIDPVDILQVEIDVQDKNPSFLSRGLGLGALACANRDE